MEMLDVHGGARMKHGRPRRTIGHFLGAEPIQQWHRWGGSIHHQKSKSLNEFCPHVHIHVHIHVHMSMYISMCISMYTSRWRNTTTHVHVHVTRITKHEDALFFLCKSKGAHSARTKQVMLKRQKSQQRMHMHGFHVIMHSMHGISSTRYQGWCLLIVFLPC